MATPTQYQAVGRRKTSVARVYLRPGTGEVTINRRPLSTYLPTEVRQRAVMSPFDVAGVRGQYDAHVNAKGGGLTGQAEATRLGIARALVAMNEDPAGTNPYPRMTLTLAGIARAHLAVVTVAGEEKAAALAAVAASDDLPASRIEAGRVLWLVDRAAASQLPEIS